MQALIASTIASLNLAVRISAATMSASRTHYLPKADIYALLGYPLTALL